MIGIEDFSKIELAVGTVVAAEPHPKADRLMILQVQFEEGDLRQIVAGVKEHYSVEDLVGKAFLFVTNLAPVALRGVESNGMILAAKDGDCLSLFMPDKTVANGSKVK